MATTTPTPTPLRPTDELSAKAARLEADLLNAPPPAAAEPVTATDKLAMTGVDVSYGSHKAVRDVNLRVQVNAITAFIGPSGCGKSTVLRCFNRMNDLIPGAKVDGQVTLDGQDIYAAGVQAVEVRRRVGLVFQRPNPFPMSIYENVAYGPRRMGIKDRATLDETVERSPPPGRHLGRGQGRLPQEVGLSLSGGQQQRLCIARTLATDPEVILMDEPCSALDPIATLKIEELMAELRAQLHHRHRDPQHAAGFPHQRPDRVLHPRRAIAPGTSSRWTPRPTSSPAPRTS